MNYEIPVYFIITIVSIVTSGYLVFFDKLIPI